MPKYAVIGLGRFGWTVATTLAENGLEVMALDKNPKLIEDIKDKVSNAVVIDTTDEEALRKQNLHEMDAVVLAIGSSIQESILTCAILKKIGVSMIYARIDNRLHGRILEFMGVQNIYLPEEMVGNQLAKTMISKNILEYINLTSGHIMIELLAPHDFVDKSLQELSLPNTRGINVIAIRYNHLTVTEDGRNVMEKRINDMPGANDIIHEGDVLILLGPKGNIDKLIADTANKKV